MHPIFFQLGWNLDGDWPIRRQNPYQHQFVNGSFMNMLFISTGIFDDKLRPQIVSVGPTAHAALAVTVESSMMNITRTLT